MHLCITITLSIVSLVGCASKTTVIVPENLPTMKEIYEQQFYEKQGLHRDDLARELHNGDKDWNKHVKEQMRPLKKAFTFLPNPTLTLFIFPHLTDAGSPVPGYTTFFKFYERDHVGLPSEVHQEPEASQSDNQQPASIEHQ